MNSSFYVKMSLSPDDLYLLSGSSNGHGYIWKVNNAFATFRNKMGKVGIAYESLI